jgi:hypothetical protein
MKGIIHIIVLLSAMSFLAACSSAPEPAVAEQSRSIEGPTSKLSAIDSLMWQQPDSALMALMAYEGDSSEYNHHYAQLLTSELLYKNDYEQTNRPELQQAVVYFDSLMQVSEPQRSLSLSKGRSASAKTTAFLAARAHYINGVGYYERDSVIDACREYLKALEVMEGHFEEKELVGEKARFMALTYTRLTELFSDFYLHEQAIYFGKTALAYYGKYDAPPWNLAWMLNQIGSHYDILNVIDSAEYYYYKGLNLLPDSNNLTFRDITTHLVYLSYKKGESSEISLNLMHKLLDMAESDKEYFSRCLTTGEIFYNETQFDSAWLYYCKVFNSTQSVDSKKLAAERLADICNALGLDSTISEHTGYLAQFATVSEKQGTLNSVLMEFYRQYNQGKMAHFHEQSIRKNTKKSTWIICSLVVLMGLSFVVIIFIRSHNKRLKKEKQMTEELLETENYSHRIKQAALSSKLKKKNKALRDTLKQLENNTIDKETINLSRHKKDYASFVGTPICQHILETVHKQGFKSKMDCVIYKEYALQKEQQLALRMAADEKMDSFTVRIRKQFPDLTDDDVTYCCLYLLGLNEADISALMQKAYPTVCERKRKIRRIVGEENNLLSILCNLP